MTSTVIPRIPFPIPCLKHHTRTIHITIPNQNPRPCFHPSLILHQPVILEPKDCIHLYTQQLHDITENIQRRLDLGDNLWISVTFQRRSGNHPLLLINGRFPSMIFLRSPLRQPLIILRPRHLHRHHPRFGRTQLIKIRAIFLLRKSIIKIILLRKGQLLGISMPLGHMSRHLHLQIGIRIGLHLLQRFPKLRNLGIHLDFRIPLRKILRNQAIVSRALVDDVRIRRVQNGPRVDGMGHPEDGIVADLHSLVVHGDFFDVFVIGIGDIGILVALGGVPFVVEFVLEVGFVPLAEGARIDGIFVGGGEGLEEGVFGVAVFGEEGGGVAAQAGFDFVEDAVSFLGVCFGEG
mmetsp:Transcript_17052/g.34645  ORF Transcript_17052/g.34645 Transcript_17052/m.34645 type:complete len:349 (-) Transcript_17052:460-1506(-)